MCRARPVHLQGADGRSMWALTWSKAHTISSGLNPGLLSSSGLGTPQPPPEPPTDTSQHPPGPQASQQPALSMLGHMPGSSAAASQPQGPADPQETEGVLVGAEAAAPAEPRAPHLPAARGAQLVADVTALQGSSASAEQSSALPSGASQHHSNACSPDASAAMDQQLQQQSRPADAAGQVVEAANEQQQPITAGSSQLTSLRDSYPADQHQNLEARQFSTQVRMTGQDYRTSSAYLPSLPVIRSSSE